MAIADGGSGTGLMTAKCSFVKAPSLLQAKRAR
jgi:hypothetical protein